MSKKTNEPMALLVINYTKYHVPLSMAQNIQAMLWDVDILKSEYIGGGVNDYIHWLSRAEDCEIQRSPNAYDGTMLDVKEQRLWVETVKQGLEAGGTEIMSPEVWKALRSE